MQVLEIRPCSAISDQAIGVIAETCGSVLRELRLGSTELDYEYRDTEAIADFGASTSSGGNNSASRTAGRPLYMLDRRSFRASRHRDTFGQLSGIYNRRVCSRCDYCVFDRHVMLNMQM